MVDIEGEVARRRAIASPPLPQPILRLSPQWASPYLLTQRVSFKMRP